MSKRASSFLSCFAILCLLLAGCASGNLDVNAVPEGNQLVQYNQAIAEIESEEELEN